MMSFRGCGRGGDGVSWNPTLRGSELHIDARHPSAASTVHTAGAAKPVGVQRGEAAAGTVVGTGHTLLRTH